MSAPVYTSGTLVLREAVRTLQEAGVADAAGDARHLLAHAMGIDRARLTLHVNDPLETGIVLRFTRAVAARAARRPVSHLTGVRQFWGRNFTVTSDVLDPRPETECLVALALQKPFEKVLDLGSGSGCIALTLLAERPRTRGVCADISIAALDISRTTAAALGVADRVTFVAGDWCARIEGTFDLIVSNPPYIAAAEMAGLAPEVRCHEPHTALTDGADGLSAYRAILSQAPRVLTPGGRLLLEIGPAQAAAVCAIARATGFGQMTVHPDLDGRDRVIDLRR